MVIVTNTASAGNLGQAVLGGSWYVGVCSVVERIRRTATATPFVHEGPRRTAKNGNCNAFCPRRATEDHGERQLQLPFCPRRATKDREERQLRLHCPRRTRRDAENGNCNFFLIHEGPRRAAENGNCNFSIAHEGPRRGGENGNCSFFLIRLGDEEQFLEPARHPGKFWG